MKVLGIDPGYDRLGIAVVSNESGKEEVIYSDCFLTSSKQDIYSRFKDVGSEIARIIEEHSPDCLSIENLYLTKNQKTAMRVSEARGIILYEASKRGLKIFEYTPIQIKMAVTGDGTSDKQRVTKMVGLLVKLPKKKIIDDEFDAVAVALTHLACYPQAKFVAKKL